MATLKGEPGKEYRIRNDRPELEYDTEVAQADGDGIIRDGDGKSFSSGAYWIVEEIDE